VSWGLEALHPPFPLARRLVGVFGTVIQIAVLPVFYPRQHLPLRGSLALQLIGNDHALDPFEELVEERLRGAPVPPALHQDIEYVPLLIHRPPEVVALSVNREKALIDVIVTTHKTFALVFHTQVYKLEREMPQKTLPASAASCAFMQNEVLEVHDENPAHSRPAHDS
jgi:hypothetical protein